MKNHNNEDILLTTKVFIQNNSKFLFLRRSRTDPNRPLTWDLPGGLLDPGESPEQAVRREAMEEAGVSLSKPDIPTIYHYKKDNGLQILNFIFNAKSDNNNVVLSYEHDKFDWLSLQDGLDLDIPEKYKAAMRKLLDQ